MNEKRKAYEEKLDAQLDEWNAQIDLLKARADKVKAEVVKVVPTTREEAKDVILCMNAADGNTVRSGWAERRAARGSRALRIAAASDDLKRAHRPHRVRQ